MVEALLEDAERWQSPLDAPPAEIRRFVAEGGDALEEVTEPRLVHFDLWPGNIFLDPADDGSHARITGLIDHERAFWGDPAAELVSLAFGGDTARTATSSPAAPRRAEASTSAQPSNTGWPSTSSTWASAGRRVRAPRLRPRAPRVASASMRRQVAAVVELSRHSARPCRAGTAVVGRRPGRNGLAEVGRSVVGEPAPLGVWTRPAVSLPRVRQAAHTGAAPTTPHGRRLDPALNAHATAGIRRPAQCALSAHLRGNSREIEGAGGKPFASLNAASQVSKPPAQAQAVTGRNELSCRKRSVPSVCSTRSW
jgi:hypothetical protein